MISLAYCRILFIKVGFISVWMVCAEVHEVGQMHGFPAVQSDLKPKCDKRSYSFKAGFH